MTKKNNLILFLAFFLFASISVSAQQPKQPSVVVIDFVKTTPEQYDNAMKYYQAGWTKVRVEAKKQHYILSYKLLTLGENAAGDWNLMLITEYADKQSYDVSEDNWKKVFAKVLPNPPTINGKTGNDLRTVVMTKILNAPTLEKKK